MELFEEAGFPAGVVNTVTGLRLRDRRRRWSSTRRSPRSPSPAATRPAPRVYARRGQGLKHVTLELGGKSPNIVFADANIDDAVKGAISGIFAATGQTCIAGSRLLVQRSVHEEVVDKVVAFARSARIGDPDGETTRRSGRSRRCRSATRCWATSTSPAAKARRCLLGGGTADSAGTGARAGSSSRPSSPTSRNDMRIAREEVFGPVLSVIPFEDEEEAVEIANDSPYGLAAGVWTSSIRRAFTMADRIRAGTVWVNTYRAVSFMAPFGGYKKQRHRARERPGGDRRVPADQDASGSIWPKAFRIPSSFAERPEPPKAAPTANTTSQG